jgi:hypothetical protein
MPVSCAFKQRCSASGIDAGQIAAFWQAPSFSFLPPIALIARFGEAYELYLFRGISPFMTSSRPRIEIDPDALKILEALAALEGQSPSDYLSALIIREGAKIPKAYDPTNAETAEDSRKKEKDRKEAEARWREFRRTKIGD